MKDKTENQPGRILTFDPEKPSFLSLAEKLYHPSYLRREGDSGDDPIESDYYRNLRRILRRLNGRIEPAN